MHHLKLDYEKKIARMEIIKSQQLDKLNVEYEDTQQKEAEEKDENTLTLKKMELNHIDCIDELQSLYEKKLQIEKDQFVVLKKEKEQMMQDFEQEIEDIKQLNR